MGLKNTTTQLVQNPPYLHQQVFLMIVLSLGLLSKNLKYVKNTCTSINLKYVFKAFTNRWRNDNIFTYLCFLRKINKIQRYGTVVFTSTLNYLPVYITSLFTVLALHSWKKDMIFWFRILQMFYCFTIFFVYLNYSKYIKLSLLI